MFGIFDILPMGMCHVSGWLTFHAIKSIHMPSLLQLHITCHSWNTLYFVVPAREHKAAFHFQLTPKSNKMENLGSLVVVCGLRPSQRCIVFPSIPFVHICCAVATMIPKLWTVTFMHLHTYNAVYFLVSFIASDRFSCWTSPKNKNILPILFDAVLHT